MTPPRSCRWQLQLVVWLGVAVSLAAPGSLAAEVVISEVLVQNDLLTTPPWLDEHGERHGWVELQNLGLAPVDLAGWRLRGADPFAEWTLPSLSLIPGQILVVWMSGKDRANPLLPLHASFRLMGRDAILLLDPAQTIIDAADLTGVPTDVSVGRLTSQDYYYDAPTPGTPNPIQSALPGVVVPRHVSVQVGHHKTLKVLGASLTPGFSTSSSTISVNSSGVVSAVKSATGPTASSAIQVTIGTDVVTSEATTVDWTANVSSLEVTGTPLVTTILGDDGTGNVIYAVGTALYATNDGMATSTWVGTSPTALASNAEILATEFGYILKSETTVYHSPDLTNWTLSFVTAHKGLRDMFASHHDPATGIGSVYVGEYSTSPVNTHSVYRGTFPPGGPATWDIAIEFKSLSDWIYDRSVLDGLRHVHSVRVDPFTGDLWVATGDIDEHSRIYVSTDGGDSFSLLGMGSQEWRTLAIWFTPAYVYWSMDTTADQTVWRVARSDLGGATIQSMTPELSNGFTVPGTEYYVTVDADGDFPVGVGLMYVETVPRALDALHKVRPLADPAYDYREAMAELTAGSLWFQHWAKDEIGRDIALLGAAPEGQMRDDRGRVFGLSERPNGSLDVQELTTVPSDDPTTFRRYAQWEPIAQDASGTVYFAGRSTPHAFYQARLDWTPRSSGHSHSCGLGPEVALLVGGLGGVRMKRRRSTRPAVAAEADH